jgi:hypothetical protein
MAPRRLLSGIGKPKSLQGEGGLAALAPLLAARLRVVGAHLAELTTPWTTALQKLGLNHDIPLAA